MKKLSVVINTKNAAQTLESCLKSVEFADEIVVVDMQSTDETRDVALKFTDKVLSHQDVGYADPARDWSINQASYDWILVVDADETVPPTLRNKIKNILKQADKNQDQNKNKDRDNVADVYLIPRKNIIFNDWLKSAGWWPDYQPRLFKKGHVSWKVGVHRMPDLKGTINKLEPKPELALTHQNYQTVEQFIDRLNRYTSLQANERLNQENLPTNRFSPASLIKVLAREFENRAFAKKGIEQGTLGVSLSLLQAFYELVITLKQWQLEGFQPKKTDLAQFTSSVKQLQKELNYWVADWHVQHQIGFKKVFWQIRRKLKV